MHNNGSVRIVSYFFISLFVLVFYLFVKVFEMFEQISIGTHTMNSYYSIQFESELELFEEKVCLNFFGVGFEGDSPEVKSNLSYSKEGIRFNYCF